MMADDHVFINEMKYIIMYMTKIWFRMELLKQISEVENFP